MIVSRLNPVDCVIDHPDLLTRCMGNKAFASRILEAFQKQLSADLDELDAAIRAEDSSLVAVIAHRVKGASANVSARQLTRIAGSLGEWAKHGDLEQLQACSQTIREAQQDFMESALQFCNSDG
jgi:HPt (histidine-containing phosphotransfer) domain-containing protein